MKDVTDATFAVDVIERSATVPVVVDLWAEWCGPCKTLGPILERVIAETNGAVELAKVDVDTNPRVGQAFAVQSIPAVFALRDGQVVDHFVGAVPEGVVREFVERLAPGASVVDQLVASGDEDSLREALAADAGNLDAAVALAESCVRATASTRPTRSSPRSPDRWRPRPSWPGSGCSAKACRLAATWT